MVFFKKETEVTNESVILSGWLRYVVFPAVIQLSDPLAVKYHCFTNEGKLPVSILICPL